MSSRYETWAGRTVARDDEGRFAESGALTGWIGDMLNLMDRERRNRDIKVAHRGGHRPPGHVEAVHEAEELWKIARTRERTDEEQDKLEDLEAQFAQYREAIGLVHQPWASSYYYSFRRGETYEVYDPYGRRVPRAELLGWKRVADLPADYPHRNEETDHPNANGVWLNPRNPGTRLQPDYRSDEGHPFGEHSIKTDLAGVVPFLPTSRSRKYHEARVDRRMAEFSRDEDGNEAEMYTRRASTGEETIGAIGGRGSREHDYRAAMKYVNPKLDRRLRNAKGSIKRSRVTIKKTGVTYG